MINKNQVKRRLAVNKCLKTATKMLVELAEYLLMLFAAAN